MERKRVVRVTDTEFELSDGSVHPHFERLDYVPTIEQFQQWYDYWFSYFEELVDERETANNRTGCGVT
jgi:hypothetical protein